ncbi:MAG: hypothetical protein V4590_00775 [Bacteroidota bacterium]
MKIHKKLFIYLFLSFIGFTVIGTLSHELGHFAVAKYLGYNMRINYGQTLWDNDSIMDFMSSTSIKYREQLNQDLDFPGKEKYFALRKQYTRDSFWITLGGPMQTLLTGSIGLVLLSFAYKRKKHAEQLSLTIWLFIFMSLFWLRQTANLVMFYKSYFFKGKLSMRGDEAKLSSNLELPVWSLDVVTGILGVIVLLFIVFKIVPKPTRFTFLLAGLFGGITGYVLWLETVGPILMP